MNVEKVLVLFIFNFCIIDLKVILCWLDIFFIVFFIVLQYLFCGVLVELFLNVVIILEVIIFVVCWILFIGVVLLGVCVFWFNFVIFCFNLVNLGRILSCWLILLNRFFFRQVLLECFMFFNLVVIFVLKFIVFFLNKCELK